MYETTYWYKWYTKNKEKFNKYRRDWRYEKFGVKPHGMFSSKNTRKKIKNFGYDLKSSEDVHHIDGNHNNNDIMNLLVVTKEYHRMYHKRLGIHLQTIYKNLEKVGLI